MRDSMRIGGRERTVGTMARCCFERDVLLEYRLCINELISARVRNQLGGMMGSE